MPKVVISQLEGQLSLSDAGTLVERTRHLWGQADAENTEQASRAQWLKTGHRPTGRRHINTDPSSETSVGKYLRPGPAA